MSRRDGVAATMPRVAIIGAGWAGLSAAVALTERGATTTIFEAGLVPGGRARRLTIDGREVDNGQHLLIGAYRETLATIRRIGVDPQEVLDRERLRVLAPGAFDLVLPRLPAPLHTAFGLMIARGPSVPEKIATLRAMRRLEQAGYRTGARTVADWLDASGARGAMRRHLWEPLCLAALNTPPETASAQVFASVLRDSLGADRADTDFLLPKRTLGEVFPEPAVRWLSARGAVLHFGSRITGVRTGNGGWNVETRLPTDDTTRYDAVILAVAPQHATALLPEDPALDGTRNVLSRFAYQPIATVYAAYEGSLRLPHGIFQPGGSGDSQWLVRRPATGDGLHPAETLVAHVLSAHGNWERLDPPTLADRLHADLAQVAGPLPPPRWTRVIRERRATFDCVPDLERPSNATALPGLWLAGDYTAGDYPATLEAAVRSGLAAAAGLLPH